MPKQGSGVLPVTRDSLLRQTEEQETLLREIWKELKTLDYQLSRGTLTRHEYRGRVSCWVARLEEAGYGY